MTQRRALPTPPTFTSNVLREDCESIHGQAAELLRSGRLYRNGGQTMRVELETSPSWIYRLPHEPQLINGPLFDRVYPRRLKSGASARFRSARVSKRCSWSPTTTHKPGGRSGTVFGQTGASRLHTCQYCSHRPPSPTVKDGQALLVPNLCPDHQQPMKCSRIHVSGCTSRSDSGATTQGGAAN